MQTPEALLDDIMSEALASIQGALASQGINASGRTSRAFSVRKSNNRWQLVYSGAGAPLETTEQGRQAGAVPTNFTDIIEQWSRDKGLPFPSDKERRKFAGAVAFGKIAKHGFGRPSPSFYGSRSETVYTPVVEEARKRIEGELRDVTATYIVNKY